MDTKNKRNTEQEGYYDDYWGTPDPSPRRMSPEERERYYAQKDAYYASRDAYYARRDAFYAAMEDESDGAEEWEDEEEEEYYAPARAPRERRAPRRKRRRRKHHFFRNLILLAIIGVIIALLLGTPPVRNSSGKQRQSGHSTLLLVGTDARGGPDTVMLLSLQRGEGGVRLLSIPPDTCAEAGVSPWEAHARGDAGRQSLMAAAETLLGFAPDGLVTVDMDSFVGAAEALGGLEFRVPKNVSYKDETRDRVVELKPGMQHLDGEQIVDLARWYTGRGREGDQALSVQRELLSAAREQWLRPENLRRLPDLWWEFSGSASTDLTRANLLWVARVLLKADPASVSMDVLPCRAVDDGEKIVYMVDRPAAYELLKDYDPYR